jgi:hypothetical protein
MDSNTSTPISETQTAAWGNTLAGCLSDFPVIVHMLNNEGLSSNPSALIAFMRNNAASKALYKILLSLNAACVAAHNKITINQAQVRIVNEQLCEAKEQA